MIKTCEKLFKYLRMDISRGICSGGFLLGIAGVFLTLMFGTVDDITLDTTVFFVFDLIQYGMPSMIVMLFCAYPYANSFCQDMENRYAYLMVQKGSVFLYTLSRSITIFLTALLTYSIGTMLFVMYLRYRMPWEDANFTSISLLQEVGGLRYFLTPGRYPVYFFPIHRTKGNPCCFLIPSGSVCVSIYCKFPSGIVNSCYGVLFFIVFRKLHMGA